MTVDDEGNIIVADSRNHRIQVSLDIVSSRIGHNNILSGFLLLGSFYEEVRHERFRARRAGPALWGLHDGRRTHRRSGLRQHARFSVLKVGLHPIGPRQY